MFKLRDEKDECQHYQCIPPLILIADILCINSIFVSYGTKHSYISMIMCMCICHND